MKIKTKKHEAPQFEVIVKKGSNIKFFAASPPPEEEETSVHVSSFNDGWDGLFNN